MIVYVIADTTTGNVVSLHREVDAEGRDAPCRDEDLLATLPPDFDRSRVAVLSMELDQVPSAREATFVVDAKRRSVSLQPVDGQGLDRSSGE